eukprot:scpid94825/ scgid0450/ 
MDPDQSEDPPKKRVFGASTKEDQQKLISDAVWCVYDRPTTKDSCSMAAAVDLGSVKAVPPATCKENFPLHPSSIATSVQASPVQNSTSTVAHGFICFGSLSECCCFYISEHIYCVQHSC